MRPISLEAPAKLNLSLRVIGRRPDGFHELDSVLVLLDLADRLLLMPGCTGLRVTDPAGDPVPDVPVRPEENLAWRGLTAGLGGSPDDALACLAVEKRIPAAAGLGGGSSDAAAGWRLGRRWSGAPEPATSAEVAGLVAIGADVPFFAAAVPAARVGGVGERVTPLDPLSASPSVVLVHPPFGLATADAFAGARPSDWSADAPTSLADALEAGTNDLLPAARRLCPEIDQLSALILGAGAVPRLTGSGPTLFAIVDGPDRAAGVVARLVRASVRATACAMRSAPASIGP